MLSQIGEHPRAIELAKSATQTYSEQRNVRPQDLMVGLADVIAWNNLASVALGGEELALAGQASLKAIAHSQSLWESRPNNPNVRFMWASARVNELQP